MTVLVGIRCQDGVVIGSDSAATFGAGPGISTMEQPTRKIDIIGDSMILAGTGQGGLGQRFCAQLTALHNIPAANGASYKGRPAVEVGKLMAQAAINDFQFTGVRTGQYGALVAFRTGRELHLCEFAVADMQPELKTPDLWYASMGSGQVIADPFLALMRKVFWKNGMPALADGIFATVWTLQHTIDINPGGVGGPMRIATLTWKDNQVGVTPIARFLSDDEIEQHKESVASAENHLANFRNVIGGEVGDAPELPVPPPGAQAAAAAAAVAPGGQAGGS